MRIWGKLIGGAFGLMLTSPMGMGLFGFIVGVWLGAQFDAGLEKLSFSFVDADQDEGQKTQGRLPRDFLKRNFAVMGYIAKSDGRVSENEIRIAKKIMDKLQLEGEDRAQAIGAFNAGKQLGFDINAVLASLRRAYPSRSLLRLFVDIQFQAAYADGALTPYKQKLLQYICQQLGFMPLEFHWAYGGRFNQGQSNSYRSRSSSSSSSSFSSQSPGQILQAAYTSLGVPATTSDAQVKKAYRRLMSQHHPDKLASKGVSDAVIKTATRKTQEIKAAYDTIKKSRGMR